MKWLSTRTQLEFTHGAAVRARRGPPASGAPPPRTGCTAPGGQSPQFRSTTARTAGTGSKPSPGAALPTCSTEYSRSRGRHHQLEAPPLEVPHSVCLKDHSNEQEQHRHPRLQPGHGRGQIQQEQSPCQTPKADDPHVQVRRETLP